MAGVLFEAPRVHDLLLLRTGIIHPACVAEPSWVSMAIKNSPWVVVRRGDAPTGKVAIGIRGSDRSHRWGGLVDVTDIALIKKPSQLRIALAHEPRREISALKALEFVEREWTDIHFSWGPTGSVGFELATGDRVITEASDLDVVLFAPQRLSHAVTCDLWTFLGDLPAKIDVRVETPFGGFSLEEYALRRTTKILIRTSQGQQLVEDPWDVSD